MSHPSPLPAATDPPAADAKAAARALLDLQMAALTQLTEIGMAVAEAAGRAACASVQAGEAKAGGADPGLLFTRAARAVRQTIALQARLSQDLVALDKAQANARAVEAVARRTQIGRLLERTIKAECDDAYVAQRLNLDARERLMDADDDDFAGLSLSQAVARICADLGLAPGCGGEVFEEAPDEGDPDPEPDPDDDHITPQSASPAHSLGDGADPPPRTPPRPPDQVPTLAGAIAAEGEALRRLIASEAAMLHPTPSTKNGARA